MFDAFVRASERTKPTVPTTREGARDQLSELGVYLAERERIHAEAKQRTEAIWQAAQKQIDKLDRRSFALGRSLFRFWLAVGRDLTQTKTLALDEAGSIKEREISGMVFNEARVIEKLKKAGRIDLIETTETVPAERLKQEPEEFLKKLGVREARRAKFYATPANTLHRVERDPKRKGHWFLALLKRT